LLRPAGFAWTCGSVIPVPGGDLLVFDFERLTDAGPFKRQALDVLDSYRPHLARAALLAARSQMAQIAAASVAMSALGLPGAVLGINGQVLSMNPLMEALSAQIEISAFDRLRITHPPADGLLHMSLALIDSDDRNVRSIPIPAVDGFPGLIVHVVPLRRQAHDVFASAVALVVATPVTAPAAPHAGLLSGLFDLTPAEDRVARAFSEGHSVESCATYLSVSRETVRSQLKSIMAKTGTSRQSELVGLLAGTTSLPLPRG
jgi:DNA-binding CsgD family transcriptional regulator